MLALLPYLPQFVIRQLAASGHGCAKLCDLEGALLHQEGIMQQQCGNVCKDGHDSGAFGVTESTRNKRIH